jgi:hypothetical protein
MLMRAVPIIGAWLVLLTAPAAAAASRCITAPGGGLTLANVAEANGLVRVVGSNGLIASARELTSWRVESTPIVHNLRGIAWAGARWVAVGDVGSILYRRGGQWIAVPNLPNSGLRGIAARPGLVATAGSNGVLLTSTDGGLTWTLANSGTTGLLWGGVKVGSSLLFSGQNSTVIASGDGNTWSPITTSPLPTGNPIAPRPLLWQMAASGSEIVAVGDFGAILEGTLARGLHGVRSATTEILRGVTVGGRRWVAVGSGGTTLFSLDGRHWLSERSGTAVDLRGVTWTGRRFVAAGDQSTVISSADGRHWRIDQSAMPCALLGLARAGRRFVAVGGSGRVQISGDGRHWRPVRRPTRVDLYAIAHGPGGFVAVGAAAAVLTSPDGTRWTSRAVPARLNLHAVGWTGSQYLAGGDRGELISSVDGRRWTRVRFPGFHSVRSFATHGDLVIAVGAGTIARRGFPSGGWQLESTGFGRFQTGVAYGAGRFVVVGHNGELIVSSNGGRSWMPSPSGVTQNLNAVAWTGKRFLAVGEGVTITSDDGQSWRPVKISARHSLRALVASGQRAIAVGDLNTHVVLAG